MLPTPFGALGTLDLNDRSTQLKLLSYDKHQIMEGMVAEKDVDHILRTAFQSSPHLVQLDVVSVMADSDRPQGRRYVLVLDLGTDAELLDRYLSQLGTKFRVKLVRYDHKLKDFVTHLRCYSTGLSLDQPYSELASKLLDGKEVRFAPVDASLRNADRQQQVFWGQLVGAYGERLGSDVVLPRIFKNFAAQPYFPKGVWDIDRVCWNSEQQSFCVIEVKHKYPFGNPSWPLSFGINCGSCGVLRDLAAAGFECFHSIMVKPYWIDRVSSTYLFSDREARARLLFCGKLFVLSELQRLYQKKSFKSLRKQTLNGRGKSSVGTIQRLLSVPSGLSR